MAPVFFMAKFRPIATTAGGVQSHFASEDGKHYRTVHQDMGPVFKHVRYMNDKINGASKKDNPNGWKFVCSIPKTVLYDWLLKNHYTLPDYACNNDGAADKFATYLESRQFHKLKAGG